MNTEFLYSRRTALSMDLHSPLIVILGFKNCFHFVYHYPIYFQKIKGVFKMSSSAFFPNCLLFRTYGVMPDDETIMRDEKSCCIPALFRV